MAVSNASLAALGTARDNSSSGVALAPDVNSSALATDYEVTGISWDDADGITLYTNEISDHYFTISGGSRRGELQAHAFGHGRNNAICSILSGGSHVSIMSDTNNYTALKGLTVGAFSLRITWSDGFNTVRTADIDGYTDIS